MGRSRSESRSVSPPKRYQKESRHKSHKDRDYDRRDRRRSKSPDSRRDRRRRSPEDSKDWSVKASTSRKRTPSPVSRRRSPSSSSGSDSSEDFGKKLDEFRAKKRAEVKEKKKVKKEHETEDEKRARRLEKKKRKEEKKASRVLPDTIPYTDLNNPFNDPNFSQPFVWGKKLETEGKKNLSRKEIEKMHRNQIQKSVEEMEVLKQNRLARQAARDDIEMMARDEERKKNSDFGEIERKFHLQQAPLRSQIRIKGNRAMPIDYLAVYISFGSDKKPKAFRELEDFELRDPNEYLKGLTGDEYEDLLADVRVYRLLDEEYKQKEFWDDVCTISNSELKKIKAMARDEVVHSSVQQDVVKTFKGKSFSELEKLEVDIVKKIKNAGRGTDVSFWENLLDTLRPQMARQRLKELHQKFLKIKLEQIRAEQLRETQKLEKLELNKAPEQEPGVEQKPDMVNDEKEEEKSDDDGQIEDLRAEDLEALEAYDTKRPLPFTVDEVHGLDDEQREAKYEMLNDRQLLRFSLRMYESGRYSPTYGKESLAMPGIEILDEQKDIQDLREKRKTEGDKRQGKPISTANTPADEKMMAIAKSGMSGEESSFAVESEIGHQDLLWSDKYRPQKPKYFNRVHTGFEWNKYNQTHYDVDNPPPKIVQGYRFNIFYPDLLDPTQAPCFTLNECEDQDFAIIRFKAGPPYEDIAFKIVNREWEVNYKHGYKCQFQNGVFQLWFYFKRYRYRR